MLKVILVKHLRLLMFPPIKPLVTVTKAILTANIAKLTNTANYTLP